MSEKRYFVETPGAVVTPIKMIDSHGSVADWFQCVAGGAITFVDGSGQSRSLSNTNAGEAFRHTIREITSSAGKVRYGTGDGPIGVGPKGDTGPSGVFSNPHSIEADAGVTGKQTWYRRVIAPFETSDATPINVPGFSLPLVNQSGARISVEGYCQQIGGSEEIQEFTARGVWKRTAAGVSSRASLAGGDQTNAAQFAGNPDPTITLNDPSTAANVGYIVATGKAATLIRWYLTITYQFGTPA